ncbi:MAG TPA: lysylphosphatidylglycerol synthase transmembrane domain-containing protein [Bryobacteraceae bacterium]|nr:lysylphosphatidylglycerol synthase transmembrane domain-containing protein [Bryobacteraceae bacterium]
MGALTSEEINPPRRKVPSWLPTAAGYTLSLASLIWVFHGVNFRQILSDFLSLDWRYVTIAVLCDLSVYVVHGWRWNTLLAPVAQLGLWRTVQSIYIGLFANEILPLRTGELIRCYLLAHWNNLHLSVIIASAAIERILDGLWMVAAFVITANFLKLPGYLVDGVRVLAGFLAAAGALLAFVIFHKHHAHAVVRESRWAATLRHVVEGLHTMGKAQTFTRTLMISLLYLVLQIVPVWALMRGYEMDLSIWAAAAVLIIVRIGTVVPNAPGNVGLYQATCVLALGLFGVDKTTATGFAFMMFGALTLPLLIGGAVAVTLTGLDIQEIRRRAHKGLHAAKHH